LISQPAKKVEAAFKIAAQLDKFDPKSKDVKNFNDELSMQIGQLLKTSNGSANEASVLKQIEFVTKQMEKNKVKANDSTNAL